MNIAFLGVTVPWAPDHVVADNDVIAPKDGMKTTLPIKGTKLYRVHVEMYMPVVALFHPTIWNFDVVHGSKLMDIKAMMDNIMDIGEVSGVVISALGVSTETLNRLKDKEYLTSMVVRKDKLREQYPDEEDYQRQVAACEASVLIAMTYAHLVEAWRAEALRVTITLKPQMEATQNAIRIPGPVIR